MWVLKNALGIWALSVFYIWWFCTSGLHPASARSISTNAGSDVMFMKHSKNQGFLVYITSHVFLFCFVLSFSAVELKVYSLTTLFLKRLTLRKARPGFLKYSVFFWKARGRNLLAECGLKARAEGESIILKWSSTIMYMAGTGRCAVVFQRWISDLLSVSTLCSPLVSPRPPSLFQQGPQVNGRSSCWRLFRILRVWPLTFYVTAPCHLFTLNLTPWYERRRSRAGRINEGACLESSSRVSSQK